jgi:hypothetical protein
MRSAWKVRVAGWMRRGQAARGMAPATRSARAIVVRIGARRRIVTRARLIRRAHRSSPQRKIRSANSFSGSRAKRSAAVSPALRSIRMSRGPSRPKEKPRSAVSSCSDEAPRSNRTPSNTLPASTSWVSSSYRPCRSLTRGPNGARRSRARARAPASRSTPRRVPDGWLAWRMASACPPRPTVASR